MPLYDVEHVVELDHETQSAIAKAFTALHAKRFKTPACFINVRFTNVRAQPVS
jgi:hypothetical protein